MSLTAKETTTSTFKPVPPGMYLARCYRIIDCGTQRSEYLGVVKDLPKVMLLFEVHGDDEGGNRLVTAKGEPMTISKNYTRSLAERATLRLDLESWRGKKFTEDERKYGFKLENILDKWCMISIVQSTKGDSTYSNIDNLLPVPTQIKQMGFPEPHNESKMFNIDEPDMELFETFSHKLKARIQLSPEWSQKPPDSKPKTSSISDMNDDIPF